MTGPSGFCHQTLALVRSQLLAEMVARLRPRCVLVDHLPLGKANELKSALKQTSNSSTRWVLGVRAIPGSGGESVWSAKSATIVRQRYVRGLWYGDPVIHGPMILSSLREHLGIPIVSTGFVSRAAEVSSLDSFPSTNSESIGVISLSWASVATHRTLATLLSALRSLGLGPQRWHVFGAPTTEISSLQKSSATGLIFSPFSPGFLPTLRTAHVCITYAGYNSITDCLWARVPVLLVIRDLQETEQSMHANSLKRFFGTPVDCVRERSLTPEQVTEALKRLLSAERMRLAPGLLTGSDTAARELIDILNA